MRSPARRKRRCGQGGRIKTVREEYKMKRGRGECEGDVKERRREGGKMNEKR